MIKWLRHPIWFVLLLLLIIANICTILWIKQSLAEVPSAPQIEKFDVKSDDEMILSEDTIKQFISIDDKDTKIKFKDHTIWIDSTSQFLNFDVLTKIKTHPTVISPGVIALNIENVDIGKLPLSKEKALRIVKKYGNLPPSVTLDEENKRFIYTLGIQQVGDTKILLKKIDSENKWHFDLELKE